MLMKSVKTFLAFTLLFASLIELQAGIQVTMDHQGDEEVSYYQDGKSAVWENGNLSLILDAKTGTVFEYNPSHGVYSRIQIADIAPKMEAMAKQQMEAMQVSPFYLQMLETQKAEAAAHKIEVRAAGTKSIAEWKAEVFEILKDGEVVKTMWVSKELDKQILSEFPEGEFRKAFSKGEQIIREVMGSDPMWEAESKLEASGTVVFESEKDMFFGEVEVEKKLISVEVRKLDAALFASPEGFEEIDYLSFMQLEDDADEDDWSGDEDSEGW